MDSFNGRLMYIVKEKFYDRTLKKLETKKFVLSNVACCKTNYLGAKCTKSFCVCDEIRYEMKDGRMVVRFGDKIKPVLKISEWIRDDDIVEIDEIYREWRKEMDEMCDEEQEEQVKMTQRYADCMLDYLVNEMNQKHECEEEECETCRRGVHCDCADNRCPYCSEKMRK